MSNLTLQMHLPGSNELSQWFITMMAPVQCWGHIFRRIKGFVKFHMNQRKILWWSFHENIDIFFRQEIWMFGTIKSYVYLVCNMGKLIIGLLSRKLQLCDSFKMYRLILSTESKLSGVQKIFKQVSSIMATKKFDILSNCFDIIVTKTHWGIMMPYNNIDLGQHWLRWWLVAWRQQAITWTNADLSSIRFCCIHLTAISREVLKNTNSNMN